MYIYIPRILNNCVFGELKMTKYSDLCKKHSKKNVVRENVPYVLNVSYEEPYYIDIISIDISSITQNLIYKLKLGRDGVIISRSAGEIVADKKIIKRLRPEDALGVGYAAGMDSKYCDYVISI